MSSWAWQIHKVDFYWVKMLFRSLFQQLNTNFLLILQNHVVRDFSICSHFFKAQNCKSTLMTELNRKLTWICFVLTKMKEQTPVLATERLFKHNCHFPWLWNTFELMSYFYNFGTLRRNKVIIFQNFWKWVHKKYSSLK